LKELVDNGEVDLNAAFRAKKANEYSEETDAKKKTEELISAAKQMSQMSGAQQKKVIDEMKEEPGKNIAEAVEVVKTKKRITQIVVSLGPEVHSALNTYSKSEKTNQDDAARLLIEAGLVSKGFLQQESTE
jgi:hypothetical protein